MIHFPTARAVTWSWDQVQGSSFFLWWLNCAQDRKFDHFVSAATEGEVETRKISAKLALRKYVEMKCQHVTVVKHCWRHCVAYNFWENGLLTHLSVVRVCFFTVIMYYCMCIHHMPYIIYILFERLSNNVFHTVHVQYFFSVALNGGLQ